MDPISWVRSNVEKAALIGAALFLLVCVIWLGVTVWQVRGDLKRSEAQVVKVGKERDAANTRLGACEVKLDEQSADIRKLSQAFTDAQETLSEERKRSAKAIRDLNAAKARFDAYKPKGETVGERMIDTHRAFLRELKETE